MTSCKRYRVTDVTGESPSPTIREIAYRVRRLCPSHRDPERFHLDKSDIAAELLTLARSMEGGR